MTTHRIDIENIHLVYWLVKQPRKTLAVTIFPDETLLVKAPEEAPKADIEDFIMRRIRWILRQKRYFAQFKTAQPKDYVSGETFRYLGRGYKMLVRKAENSPKVLLKQGTLTVQSDRPTDSALTKQLLVGWYKERANTVFNERLDLCMTAFPNEERPEIVVRKMTRRWGSYLRRNHRIHLNSDLIQANKAQIDYVITHELCHIQHPNHDRGFYRSLESKLPDWPALKSQLELETPTQSQ